MNDPTPKRVEKSASTVQVYVGCDPEVFVIEKTTKAPVSPHKLTTGTKQSPARIALRTPLSGVYKSPSTVGGLQVDGLALEFNTAPAHNADHFYDQVSSALSQIRALLPTNLDLGLVPTTFFSKEEILKAPPANLDLGCDPDFDAYSLKPNVRPTPPDDPRGIMRTAAGHLHIGFYSSPLESTSSDDHLSDCVRLVRNLDQIFMGVEKLWDKDTERRKMYGKPGCFRPKNYGVEYRSLSNAWLAYPNLYRWIWDTCFFVTHVTKKDYDLSAIFKSRSFSSIEEYNSFIEKNVPPIHWIVFTHEMNRAYNYVTSGNTRSAITLPPLPKDAFTNGN